MNFLDSYRRWIDKKGYNDDGDARPLALYHCFVIAIVPFALSWLGVAGLSLDLSLLASLVAGVFWFVWAFRIYYAAKRRFRKDNGLLTAWEERMAQAKRDMEQ